MDSCAFASQSIFTAVSTVRRNDNGRGMDDETGRSGSYISSGTEYFRLRPIETRPYRNNFVRMRRPNRVFYSPRLSAAPCIAVSPRVIKSSSSIPSSLHLAICSRLAPAAKVFSLNLLLTDLSSTKLSFFSGRTNAAAVMRPVSGSAQNSAYPSTSEKVHRGRRYGIGRRGRQRRLHRAV